MAAIARTVDRLAVTRLLEWNPVVAILGARQVGKSTLARDIVAAFDGPATVLDLEDRRT